MKINQITSLLNVSNNSNREFWFGHILILMATLLEATETFKSEILPVLEKDIKKLRDKLESMDIEV